MNVSAPFIKRPVMTTLVMLMIIVCGYLAFRRLPVTDLPAIEHPHIQISAGYLGASPEEVLYQVTVPLEKELAHVKGVQEMNSQSSMGHSSISLSFGLTKNMDEAIRDVQAALNRAEPHLPHDLNPRPAYHLQRESQEPIIYLILTSEGNSAQELREYADGYIIPKLSRLEGVAQVSAFGSKKSIWLRLNPELMALREVGFNEVMEAVAQQTHHIPLGSIQTDSKRLALEWPHSLLTAKELERLQVGKNKVRIGDIGEISDTSPQERTYRFVTRTKSAHALIVGIQKISDAHAVAISKEVRRVVAELKEELPSAFELNLWFDKAVWIEESLADVEWSLLFAFGLVVLVIYLSLGRLTESLITSAALPLSLLGTFGVMYAAGFSLDLLSLLALTLSVGFVVDDAIVVLENIVRRQEEGEEDRWQASLNGSKQISFTILSMTLSLVAVFIPLLFMQGINGRLFREFSLTLAAAILVSGFISLTLTPMLCSKFLTRHARSQSVPSVGRFLNFYGRTLKACFRFPKTVYAAALLCSAATFFLFNKLPVELIPSEDRGFFFTFIQLPSGMAPADVSERQKMLESILSADPAIESYLSLYFHDNLLFVTRLLSPAERPAQKEVIAGLKRSFDALAGIEAFIQPYQLLNLDLDLGSPGQYEMVVKGLNFEVLEEAGAVVEKAFLADPMITFAQNGLKQDTPILAFRFNEELMQHFGFQKKEIQNLLSNAFGQGIIGTIRKGVVEENIYMELFPEFQNRFDAPKWLYLTTAQGDLVPLKLLAEWEEKLSRPNFENRDQLPAGLVRFSLSEGVPPNLGLQRAEEIARQILPPGVTAELGRSAKTISTALSDTLFLLLISGLVMYLVLGILYESFIHPLTILSSLPFACFGGILTLLLFDEPISIFSAVGFLLLIGIVKKNGIMLVDYAIEMQKSGKTAAEAVYQASIVRFRPIMMTTLAAIMGAIPIAIGLGEGAEIRKGLGLVIIGGLLFSQLVTLYVTPILYLGFDKLLYFRFFKPHIQIES